MSALQVEACPVRVGKVESDGGQSAVRRTERRKRARTEVHWPVRLVSSSAEGAVDTITWNLSSDGFYCLSKVPFAPGESIHCTLRLPRYDATSRQLALHCQIHILRVEAINGDTFGIACRIEDYHFIHR
jgi:hypothetical protein